MTVLRALVSAGAAIAIAMCSFSPVLAQDVRLYGVVKGQAFVQTNSGPAASEGAALQIFISPSAEGVLTQALVRTPGGGNIPLVVNDHDSEFVQFFPSTVELNATYPNGPYVVELGTVHDGNRTNLLNLTGDSYPATPHFLNFSAAQSIDPAAPFQLTWDPISGATSNDFLQVEISDCLDQHVIETPSPGQPGALNGTRTSFLLPARALRPGQKYEVVLQVGRFVSENTNSYPGARGIAGYLVRSRSTLATMGTPTGCPMGRLELVFGYPNFTFGGSTQGMVHFPQGIPYYFALFNLQSDESTNFPSYVIFNGPPGSGLNNTTNFNGGFGGSSAWYSSPSIPTPPFPPGGVYSVQLGGESYQFNLLDPNAANQQVLLVPTAIVNGAGLLTELRWIYKDINGATVGPQPFMAGIEIRIDGQNQRLYEAGNRDEKIPATTNAHLLSQPIVWTNVNNIQMLFRDDTGSSYGSFWNNAPAPMQFVTTDLPSGLVGSPYFGALMAFGGVQPYAWSILSGSLPPGLNLVANSGAINGTPGNGGTFNFTVQVRDAAANHLERNLSIRITSSNSPPFISFIGNQNTSSGVSTPPIAFQVGDAETPAPNLNVSGSSSDTSLVRQANIVFGGAGSNRTVTVTPEPGRSGNVAITISVSDGQSTASSSFPLQIDGMEQPQSPATEPNVDSFIVLKGQGFLQTNAAAPVAAGPSNTLFRSWVSLRGDSTITNVLLVPPGSSPLTLSRKDGEFQFEQSFASPAAMDSALANGVYVLRLATSNQGLLTNSLLLGGNSYPATPHLANFGAAQSINPLNDFTLSWDALSGTTTNDYIFISLNDCHDHEVFSTPPPGKPDALSATRTNVLVPGRTLRPGQTYKLEMLVIRLSQLDTSSIPGALGLAGYVKRLEATLATGGGANGCPFGQLNFVFRFRPGGFAGTQGTMNYPQRLEQYQLNFSTENDPNPPPVIAFNGPPGSGLNNTTNNFFNTGGGQASYGSASLDLPPFPPGGLYTVLYKNTTYGHPMLPPNAESEQVLVVPRVLLDEEGRVTEVNWTYRDTNGTVIPPPPYLRQVRVQLNGMNGPLFPTGNGDQESSPAETNRLVEPPVAWTNVWNVQTSFRDLSGNEFQMDWQRLSPSVQIATPNLPGGQLSNEYHFVMTAFGGSPPYAWSLSAGQLPPGLALDADTGEISGVAAASGAFSFNVRVTDDSAQQNERSFRIKIGGNGPDARMYLVGKGRRFQQTSANSSAPAQPAYQFISFVESDAPGRITNATLSLPGGAVRALVNDFDQFKWQQAFTNQETLDGAFANGPYVFHISGVNDGPQTASLLLTNNAYPLPPRVANWSGLQDADPREDLTLSWNPFVGASSNDFIAVSLMNNQGEEFFSTPDYLEPNFLNGLATAVTIPANTLAPFAPNQARLLFAKRVAFNTNGYPNVPGVAAYFTETYFTINTLNPAGVLQFSTGNYRADENAGTVEITVNRLGGAEGTVTVDYATVFGSAGESDLAPASGTLTFGPDVTSQTFSVTLLDDEMPEGPETASLLLTNATGGASVGKSSATLTILDDDLPPGPNVRRYLVAKGQAFVQSNAGAPTVAPEKPFRFVSFADPAFPGGILAASLRTPGAVTNELSQGDEDSSFELNQIFTNKAALDAAFRNGLYTFMLQTLNDGAISAGILLPADAYPPTPHLANWPAAQTINAYAAFRLAWDPFTGGSAKDYIQLSIGSLENDEKVFESPGLGEPGALNGTNTSMLIPAGTFRPGQSYRVELLFVNSAAVNTDDPAKGIGLGAYFKETSILITTATPPPPQGQIQFVSALQSVSETNGSATVGLIRVGGSQGAVGVTVGLLNGTATAGADYTGASHEVTFADGETNAVFTFELVDDSIYEGPESVKLFLSNPTGGATLAGQTNTIVTIVDNELPPTPGSLQFSAASYTVSEAGGYATITVTRSGGSLGEVTVDYATSGDSASSADDFEETLGTLVFPNGVTSRTFAIAISDDDLDETNEVFVVTLSHPSNGATLGARASARITIADNDSAGSISFARPAYVVSETNETAEITVRRTGGLAEGITVDYAAFAGTATDGEDFDAVSGTLTFDAGETEKVISVPLYDDVLPEGNETFSLILSNATGGATLGLATNAVVTILDDEVVIQFSRTLYTNSEAAPAVTFVVTRTGPATEEVSIDYGTSDGTAVAGDDYTETSGTLVFGAGVTNRTFTVPLINDTEAEEDETFTVTLSNPSGNVQLGERDTATVVILDNDEAGIIAFSATNYSVKETATFALITVTRTGGRASDVAVDFAVVAEGGTADGESDYISTNGTLVFGAGVTRLSFVVPIRDDAMVEENETIALRLSNPTGGATLGTRSEATVTILDNDVAGAFRFSAQTYRASETGGVATITVSRSGGKASARVDYATADGTAMAGVDYTSVSGTLLFGSNEVTKTFTVPILDDALPDGNGTVLLSLSNPDNGGRLITPTNAVLTILDDELGVQFATASYVVSEGARSVAVTVVRAGISATPFTVHYATADGTALAGSDYTAKSGTLTFGPGSTTQTILIPIRNDTTAEEAETFTVTLSNPSGAAQLGSRSVATITIIDNDATALRAARGR